MKAPPSICVVGFGAVGQTLSRLCRATGVNVSAVSDFSGFVVNPNSRTNGNGMNQQHHQQQSACIPAETLEALEQAKKEGLQASGGKEEPSLMDLVENSPLLRSKGLVSLPHESSAKSSTTTTTTTTTTIDTLLKSPGYLGHDDILCDCSASEATTSLLLNALDDSNLPSSALKESGRSIVLANKKPLTNTYSQFECLTARRGRIRFEATCGAGLPTMTALRRVVDSGDSVIEAVGALSGTLGYIMSGLDAKRPFSEVVAEAKKLGFTEPDPRDDLSGTDVARKALIIARCAGMKLEMEDIKVEPLFPVEWASLSVDEFMSKLPEMDKEMEKKVMEAEREGSRLRYAAVIKPSGDAPPKVGLVNSPIGSPLASLVGTDNLLSLETEFYSAMAGAAPLVIQGPGAGLQVTAAGVLSDVFDLAGERLKTKWST